MSRLRFRLTVLLCALSWLLVGLHLPALHEMTSHGHALSWTVLAIMSLLFLVGIGSLWIILRDPRPGASAHGHGTPAV